VDLRHEKIEHTNSMTCADQRIYEMRAYKTGPARNQNI
jgi:hypothetical protein